MDVQNVTADCMASYMHGSAAGMLHSRRDFTQQYTAVPEQMQGQWQSQQA